MGGRGRRRRDRGRCGCDRIDRHNHGQGRHHRVQLRRTGPDGRRQHRRHQDREDRALSEPLDRDALIALLDRLGSEQDEEALAAARQIHTQVSAAGVSWDELLTDEESEPADSYDDDGYDDDEEPSAGDDDEQEEDAPKTSAAKEKRDREALALIDQLLAKSGISEDFKAELEDYKVDIKEDEFSSADHRYIRAVHKRLSGKKR